MKINLNIVIVNGSKAFMAAESTPEPTTRLLQEKYKLGNEPEVTRVASLTERRTGRQIQEPLTRIQTYLDHLHQMTDREHGVNAIKRFLHSKYVIKPDEIPQSYWDKQQRNMQTRGERTDWEEFKQQATDTMIRGQESTLDKWVDYMTSTDVGAAYPDAIRYWVIREVSKLSTYDQTDKRFRRRDNEEGITNPFPELNQEALSLALDLVVKYTAHASKHEQLSSKIKETKQTIKKLGQESDAGQQRPQDQSIQQSLDAQRQVLEELHDQEYELLGLDKLFPPADDETVEQRASRLNSRHEIYQHIKNANFAKLYAWAFEKVKPNSVENLTQIEGGWAYFPQHADPTTFEPEIEVNGTKYKGKPLSPSVLGSGWCTAVDARARQQLNGGAMYIFYSLNNDGSPTVPRILIRMQESHIAEIRGIAPQQNLDPYIPPVLATKLEEFGDEGKTFEKRTKDMEQLTQIEQKIQTGNPLNREELAFLYEINGEIEGFRFDRDIRIETLRSQRDHNADMLLLFGCTPTEIARVPSEIKPSTKVYIGPLEQDTLTRLTDAGVEHIFTSFPEGQIRIESVHISGKPNDKLLDELKTADVNVNPYAEKIMEHPDFTSLSGEQAIKIVRLKVKSLGFARLGNVEGGKISRSVRTRTETIYQRAHELGLDLCPPGIIPEYILQYREQLTDENIIFGMKPITSTDIKDSSLKIFGNNFILNLYNKNGLSLGTQSDRYTWHSDHEFAFILPEKTQSA